MSKSYKIDGELISSSGEKLRRVGYLIIWGIGISLLSVIMLISDDEDFHFIMGSLIGLSLLFLSGVKIKKRIGSGNRFINFGIIVGVIVGFFLIYITVFDFLFYENTEILGLIIGLPSLVISVLIIKNIIDSGNGFINSVQIHHGVEKEYWDNGNLKSKYNYIDGELNGPYELYNDNGELKEKGTYKLGKRDGKSEFWDHGELRSKRTYKDGELDGSFELYSGDGELIEKRTYKDGKQIEDQ